MYPVRSQARSEYLGARCAGRRILWDYDWLGTGSCPVVCRARGW